MKTEFMVAITQLASEKNLPREVVLAAVESALVSAYKKDIFAPSQDILVKIGPNTGEVKVYVQKAVVDELTEPLREILITEALKINKDAQVGDVVNIESTPPNAGRIAAQTAKQVILQRLHEAEHHAIYEEFINKEGDIVTGIIQRIDPRQIYVDLGKSEAILPASEQVRGERYRVGQRLRFYLLEVSRTSRGPQILLSRSHRNLLRRLFELEIPEIYNGTVELKSVAREPGYRSKVAVAARQGGIDPVGCCVGLRGIRIQNIVNELSGEKIDVVQWDDNPAIFIASALSPAQVLSVEPSEIENTAVVVVPDKQLSLAIGKEGQNARLAAKLTGWRVDIKSASAAEVERARLAEEAITEIEEMLVEEEKRITEAPTLDETLLPEIINQAETPSAEPTDQAEETITPLADYELVLTSEALSLEQPTEKPQLRFAEDIMPARSAKPEKKAKRKGTSKKELELREAGVKSKKARQKQVDYLEDDEFTA